MFNENDHIVKEFSFSKPVHLENGETLDNKFYGSIIKRYTSRSSTGILWEVNKQYNGNTLVVNEWESYAVAEMDFSNFIAESLNDDIFYKFTAERV